MINYFSYFFCYNQVILVTITFFNLCVYLIINRDSIIFLRSYEQEASFQRNLKLYIV